VSRTSSLAEGGGVSRDSGERSARSAKTKGPRSAMRHAEARRAKAEAERGMAEMSEKFRATGGDLYVSETGEKREAID